jgi:predicted AlkP superfamily phosphohydrolase/phosphomutase
MSGTSPLVILGLDVGDPDALRQWVREGRLPTLASLMQRGWWGTTGGPELVCEHGLWVSLCSGLSRSRFGYFYFRQLVPRSYDLALRSGRDLAVEPFWSELRDGGHSLAVIDVPDVAPVRGLDGIQLSNWAVHGDPTAAAAEPPDLLARVERSFGPRMEILERLNSDREADREIQRRLLERVRKKGALLRELLRERRFDLVMAVFGESHTVVHQLWDHRRGARADGAGPERDELGDGIRGVYEAIDREMGSLLAVLPPEANVFVVSSLGIEDHYPTTELAEAFCRSLGYQAAPAAGAGGGDLLSALRRVVPERWRLAASRHLSRETRERLLAQRFRTSTDWSRTTAFAPPSFYTTFLRVNLRGREPQGRVEPGAEYLAVLARLEADLAALIDPRSGEPAVKKTERAVALFGGGPPESLPDLFVHWRSRPYFLERVAHPRAELVQRRGEFHRSSDHTHSGFVAAAGPSIPAAGDAGEIPLLDLAPTFLSLLGRTAPPRMDGKPLDARLVAPAS